MPSKSPVILIEAQRAELLQIPDDMSERELARHYTLSPDDLALIHRRRRGPNRLGFAVQLCLLRFPGRTLIELGLERIPPRVIGLIARQVGVPPTALVSYGERPQTLYEHLDEIKAVYGYHTYRWQELLTLARHLLPHALESDQALPLIHTALRHLRERKVIAPAITTIERLVWGVQHIARRRVNRLLTSSLTPEQCHQLDALLVVSPQRAKKPPVRRGTIPITWLRTPPGDTAGPQLMEILDRLAFIATLALPAIPAELHRNRVIQYARQAARYRPQPLLALAAERRYALLVAHLDELRQDLVDDALLMFDKLLVELLRRTAAKQAQEVVANAKAVNAHLAVLTTASAAFLQATREQLDPIAAVFAAVPEELLSETVVAASQALRPVDFDYLDLLEAKYTPVRGPLLRLPRTVPIEPLHQRTPALKALDHIHTLAAQQQRVEAVVQPIGKRTYHAPLTHLNDRWRPHVLQGNTINPNYYEASALEALRSNLRAGEVSVPTSRRYRAFAHYLLPRTRWSTLKASGQTRLAVGEDVHAYLSEQEQGIHEQLLALQRDLNSTPGLSLDAQGQLHLGRLEPDVPDEAKDLRRRLYAMLPRIDLPDLLIEVNDWVQLHTYFTHLQEGSELNNGEELRLLAAIMGTGMNLGLTKLAAATPYRYTDLSWVIDWFVRDETLKAALGALDNFVLHHPFSKSWGTGTRSSSDGLRIRMGVQAAHADYNAEYSPRDRSVTIYIHVADIGPPYHQRVIGLNDSEALHVIDALCHHETDLDIHIHATDTAGATEHVFALCTLLGFEFTPRIKDVLSRSLVTLGPKHDYGPLNSLIGGRLNRRVITEHWDAARHIAASIRHGSASATTLMRRLAASPRKANVARALTGIGQIGRTRFTLAYLHNETLRRQVQISLNRGEAVNALARALFFGRRGMFRDRALEDQMHRASCLMVLIAAISAWNTVYLSAAVDRLRLQGEEVPAGLLQHLSPLGWEHINLLGQYRFERARLGRPDQLRPLRSQAEIDADDGDER